MTPVPIARFLSQFPTEPTGTRDHGPLGLVTPASGFVPTPPALPDFGAAPEEEADDFAFETPVFDGIPELGAFAFSGEPEPEPEPDLAGEAELLPTPEPEAHPDVEAAVAEAVAQERARAEADLAAARDAWVEVEAERLAAGIEAGLAALEMRLAEGVARALRPLLEGAVVQRALAELEQKIEILLADAAAPPLRIAGPADLLARLEQRLPGRAIEFVPDTATEVTVLCEATQIQTRLARWRTLLAEPGTAPRRRRERSAER